MRLLTRCGLHGKETNVAEMRRFRLRSIADLDHTDVGCYCYTASDFASLHSLQPTERAYTY